MKAVPHVPLGGGAPLLVVVERLLDRGDGALAFGALVVGEVPRGAEVVDIAVLFELLREKGTGWRDEMSKAR